MKRTLMIACLMAATSVVANAQDRALKPVAEGTSVKTTRLSVLMKSKIVIQDDQSAGTVTDVVLSDNGCVDYVVASYDNQYYVIPYSAVTYRAADQIVFVDIAPAQFQKVKFFTGNNWPDFYASSYQQNVFSVFNVTNVRRDGPRSTLKPPLDRDREGDRDRNRDRDGDRNRDRDGDRNRDRDDDRPNRPNDSARDRDNTTKDDADAPKKPNPGVVDPPKTDPDAKAPKTDSGAKDTKPLPKPEAPKADLPKPLPKPDVPKTDPLKPATPPAPKPIKP